MATTTYQFGVSFILIIDDVIEEVIGHLIETGNLDQLYQLGSCARGHSQEQSGLISWLSKDKGENRQPEMVCLQDSRIQSDLCIFQQIYWRRASPLLINGSITQELLPSSYH